MTLDEILTLRRAIARPSLPDLLPLVSAKKKVMERWPDVVAKPPEKDHERLLAKFRDILENNLWDDVKLTLVLRVANIAFDAKYRQRHDIQPILTFFLEEFAATEQATFINGMMSVYVASFAPGATHTRKLAEELAVKRSRLNSRWQNILKLFPGLLDAERAHQILANAMLANEDPWTFLTESGFPTPQSGELMDHAHLQFIEGLRPQLHTLPAVEKLFRWVRPRPGIVRTGGSSAVIIGVLSRWQSSQPSAPVQQALLDNLIASYNDPRTNRGLWAGVPDDILNVIFRWLTREDMRFFTGVVDATQNNHMWPPRRDFWLQLYDEKLVDQAWVAFCPSAERYARSNLIKSEGGSQRRFGRQVAGGSRTDTSLLIMKVGAKIVVDGCHNYKTHIFDEKDPAAPRLFQWEYDCNNIMRRSQASRAHSSIPHWKEWVRETINATVKVPAVKATPLAQKKVPESAPPSSRPLLPSKLRMEAMKDARHLANQLHGRDEFTPEVKGMLERLEKRRVLSSDELAVLRPLTQQYAQKYGIYSLEQFIAPIFDREMPPTENTFGAERQA